MKALLDNLGFDDYEPFELCSYKEAKIKVLELDQWSGTGDLSQLTMTMFESDPVGTLQKIEGNDAKAVRTIFGGSAKVKEVSLNARPNIGSVFYKEEDGGLVLWKSNYDSSG